MTQQPVVTRAQDVVMTWHYLLLLFCFRKQIILIVDDCCVTKITILVRINSIVLEIGNGITLLLEMHQLCYHDH